LKKFFNNIFTNTNIVDEKYMAIDIYTFHKK